MGAIVDIQLKRLQKLLDERKITLDVEPEARDWLADKGYDPAYGARPLKRVIQKAVQGSLAEQFSPARDPRLGGGTGPRSGPLGLSVGLGARERAPSAGRDPELTTTLAPASAGRGTAIRDSSPSGVQDHLPEAAIVISEARRDALPEATGETVADEEAARALSRQSMTAGPGSPPWRPRIYRVIRGPAPEARAGDERKR